MISPNYAVFAAVFALSACTLSPEKPQAPFNAALVKQIKVKVEATDSGNPEATATQVAKNLVGWGYPMAINEPNNASHTLTATIGSVKHSQTPTGFSFSSGNSDPRAMEFQKMQVLPISCEITSIAQPEQHVYLQMDFGAEGVFSKRANISADTLIDHVSTVCFNLLSELDWPKQAALQSLADDKVRWMPEVRIENVTESVNTEPEQLLGKKVTRASDGRKQIIIHNLGSPVILQFGHERR